MILAKVDMTSPVTGETFPYTLLFSDAHYNQERTMQQANDILAQAGGEGLSFGRNAGFAPLSAVSKYVTRLTCNYVTATDKYVANLRIGHEYEMRIVRENASDLIGVLTKMGIQSDYDKFTRKFSFDTTNYAL